jgi:hypothetical protein
MRSDFDDDDNDEYDLAEFKSFRQQSSHADSSSDDDDADAPMPPRTSAPTDDEIDASSRPAVVTHEESAFSKRLRKRAALGLEWRDLSLWLPQAARGRIKRILRKVSAECPRRRAALGDGQRRAPARRSLLNVLAMRVTGERARHGAHQRQHDSAARQFRRISSYVEQDDRLFPWLTVRETLLVIAARLRLPSRRCKRADKERLVEDIISRARSGQVRRHDCRQSPIVRGMSGRRAQAPRPSAASSIVDPSHSLSRRADVGPRRQRRAATSSRRCARSPAPVAP